jgi:hypothetical protein
LPKLVAGLVWIALMLAAIPAAAQNRQRPPSPDWQRYGEWEPGIFFYDPATVVSEGRFRFVWTRVDLSRPLDSAVRMFSRFRYDCTARTVDLLRLEGADAQGNDMFAQSVADNDREVEPIVASSPNHALAAIICR